MAQNRAGSHLAADSRPVPRRRQVAAGQLIDPSGDEPLMIPEDVLSHEAVLTEPRLKGAVSSALIVSSLVLTSAPATAAAAQAPPETAVIHNGSVTAGLRDMSAYGSISDIGV